MPRCQICDYSTDTPAQSSYFLSLPASERGRKRYQYKGADGESAVGCTDCYVPKKVLVKENEE